MKNRAKILTCGAGVLFAAGLCLQAQSTSTPSQPRPSSPPPASTPNQQRNDNPSLSTHPSPSSPQSDTLMPSTSNTTSNTSSSTTFENDATRPSQSGLSASTSESNTLTTSTETDTQVTTIVHQIDAQGPAVMQRVSTEFADIACTEANARQLVEALHRGTEVTLTGENGKSVTFTPTTSLGYGETYLAMALAAETLRQNGVTDCATPEQWRAVFLGGPLTVSSTVATATARSDFPGILVLRSQGQGWGRIAQTSNVQINQVVSNARSSFSLETNESSGLSAPTGEMDTEPKSSDTTKGTSGRKQSTDPKTGASAYGSSTQKAHEKADNSSSRSSHHRDTDADTGNRTKEDKKIKKDRDDPRN